ncbi:hypothetical protein E2C06_00800 [Dankookia rubra]|uniref:Uncharacterized protein n=1 Tax=Dankookia rubra TaxID=1442381 RepID=A0A4V3AC87_9PROT|nr:hypothetical protein [Dankookia rubra]TDH64515.1 hypothetical protein E2C06_00800 [Dankookia rubra]
MGSLTAQSGTSGTLRPRGRDALKASGRLLTVIGAATHSSAAFSVLRAALVTGLPIESLPA